MLEAVKKIINKEIREVLMSPEFSILLVRTYSLLYLNGRPCRMCEVAQRQYYEDLKRNGMAKAIEYEKVKSRTLVTAFNGNKYVPAIATHLSSTTLTDEVAIKYLETGVLREADFKKLPDGYIEKSERKAEPVEVLQPETLVFTKYTKRKSKAKKS